MKNYDINWKSVLKSRYNAIMDTKEVLYAEELKVNGKKIADTVMAKLESNLKKAREDLYNKISHYTDINYNVKFAGTSEQDLTAEAIFEYEMMNKFVEILEQEINKWSLIRNDIILSETRENNY